MAVLDTSFLIALERGDEDAVRLHAQLQAEGESLYLPAAVWTEFLAGFPPADRRVERTALMGTLVFQPFDVADADIATDLQHRLTARGTRLSWHDLQVAATALRLGEALVTADETFAQVVGLRVLHF